MTDITAEMVRTLRDKTNCPMDACKHMLVKAEGDMREAERLLRNNFWLPTVYIPVTGYVARSCANGTEIMVHIIDGKEYVEASAHIALIDQVGSAAPIDMVLHCPKCGTQHIDETEPPLWGHKRLVPDTGWANPPHRSHLCADCGHIWRPADVPTNGVRAVKTKGQNDSPVVQPARGSTNPPPLQQPKGQNDSPVDEWERSAMLSRLSRGLKR